MVSSPIWANESLMRAQALCWAGMCDHAWTQQRWKNSTSSSTDNSAVALAQLSVENRHIHWKIWKKHPATHMWGNKESMLLVGEGLQKGLYKRCSPWGASNNNGLTIQRLFLYYFSLKGTYYAKITFIRCLNTVVWPQCVKTTSQIHSLIYL